MVNACSLDVNGDILISVFFCIYSLKYLKGNFASYNCTRGTVCKKSAGPGAGPMLASFPAFGSL